MKVPLLAGALLLGGIEASLAADIKLKTTDAANTSSFTGSTNWSNGAVPSVGNAYYTTNFTLRTPNPTASGNNYVFGGDSLSVDPGGRLLGKIGNNAANNTTFGTITVANLILNGGTLDQAGANGDNSVLTVAGNVSVNAASFVGALAGTANGSARFETLEFTAPISGSGALQVSGPVINAGGDTGVVKLSAPNPYSGTITVSNGTGNIIASAVNRILQLNDLNSLSNATLNLDSSQASPVSFAAGVNLGNFNVGALTGRASQTLTDTAGSPVTLSVGGNNAGSTYTGALTDGGNLVKVGSGTLTLTGTNTYSGTTTVSGGSLQLGNGGTGGSLVGGNTLAVNGNLTINRNNTVTQGTDFSGSPITGNGSFTQVGNGTTILNAANSYSGSTTVSAGKLVVSSAQTGTGAIIVANGAKLGITVSAGSQLPPSSLTLGTSAATTLEFDGVNSTAIAPINTGSLSVGGQVTVNINTGTFTAGNSYPLIHWTGSGPANASSFTLGISPGLTANFSVSGNTLYLNVAAVSDIWAGAVNGNWDTSTANWTGNATIFANSQSVLFDDSAVGTTSVTVTAPVQPGSMIFNNSSLPYSITSSGANSIGGSGGLTKANNGSLTLSGGANNYTGATIINGGILSIGTLANGGQPSDIGAASVASANLVLNNSTLQFTGGSTSTDRGATVGAGGGTLEVSVGGVELNNSGVIVGSGALTKTGNGALTLSGASTFSGGVTLSAGQLNINNGGSSSANSAIGVGTLTLAAGTTIDNTSGGNVTLLPNNAQVWGGNFTYAGSAYNLNLGNGPVSLPSTCIVMVNGNTLTVGGAISGAGGITKMGPGTLALLSASTFNGGVNIQEGTLAIGSDWALGTGLLNFNGAAIQSVDGTAHTITNAINFGHDTTFGGTGNLKFTATPPGNATAKTLTVNNPQTEISGALGGASARTVAGTGTLILSGANTYSAGTTITPGATMQLGNGGTNGSLSTSGAIVNDGTLKFNRTNALVQGVHFSGAPITGIGSVVQDGSGTTTLNAANAYTGLTTVNNGELFITPAYQGAGDVVVGNGAKFGVSAGFVTNSATIGNLILGGGGATMLDFSYSQTGNPTNAALNAGTVTVSGTSAIRIGGSFAVGSFPVLKYGTLSGAFASAVAGPRGVTATLSNDVVNKVLYVTVSGVGNGIVWTGTNNVSPNLWDLNTTANWLIGALPTTYIENVPPGDAVTFNDSGNGLVLLGNAATPARVTINNASVNYTFQGAGQINSLAGLTKIGAGSVTMNVPGTFASSTVLSNGTFSIGANQTFANLSGNSAVTVSTNAPTLTLNNSLNTTFSGNMSGALGLTKTGTGQFTMTGSNNISGNLYVGSGTLTLDSGLVNLNNFGSIGHVGTDNGTLTLKGTASFTNNSDFNVGDVGASVGTVNIQDNASLTVSSFYIGSANAAGSTASGTVNQTGGTVTQTSSATGTFAVGGRVDTTSIGGVGVYNMVNGILNATSAIRVGAGGVGTFNQSGGTVNAGVDVNLARFVGSAGTYNLDGGSLRTARVTSSTAVNAILNLNGGVLIAHDDNTSLITNLTTVNVRNGGAVIDTAGLNLTVDSTLQHSGLSGDNAIDGGLTKRGAGTLTLAEWNASYTGPTIVTGGALNLLPGSVSSLNNLTLTNGALGLTVNGGGSSIYATSLKLAGNSGLNFNFGVVSGSPVAALNVSGSLTASGTTIVNVNGYGFSVGQFTLVDYTGTPLANLNNFQLGSLPVGVVASLSNNAANTSIDLVVMSVDISTWIPLIASDLPGTSSFNSAGYWQDGNPPSTPNGYVTRAFTLRSPADAGAYTFGGTVLAIDAGGRFILKGTNGQAITVPNMVMNGGVVDYAVGAGDNFTETLAGNITLNAGSTSYLGALGSAATAETLFVDAQISGSGNLQLNGVFGDVGVVVLTANNNYSGTTTVAAGTLLVNGAIGNSTTTVSTNGTLGGTGSIAGPLTIQPGGNLAPGIPSRGVLTASIGTLTASGTATIGGTALMKLDRSASPSSDRLNASAIVINAGATLIVTNMGTTSLVAGDTFTLFSGPVSSSFATVTLPPLSGGNVQWTNKLAINGTIAVVATSGVNPNATNITATVAGGNLTLSWPSDHTGWTLQVQTNSVSVGLGSNWFDVPGSSTTNSVTMPVVSTNGVVFYRLKL
ncbi:autotransporter-associated beta strand repeat-containing protein [Pedosphaera parvula]|uniref:autotransporter-associated beta strand repeat-containing protein n=1 Tax=Pedosphaera parvula TaxID=1032527 RepID=UPI001ED8FD68|nr:autotransporter-associated beta strand repeat-containing protein [Pedosphaera parvula]